MQKLYLPLLHQWWMLRMAIGVFGQLGDKQIWKKLYQWLILVRPGNVEIVTTIGVACGHLSVQKLPDTFKWKLWFPKHVKQKHIILNVAIFD